MSNELIKTKERYQAEDARRAIYSLVIQGKIDATDLKIIELWHYSPIPSMREAAQELKIDQANICRRSQRIKSLIAIAIS